MRSHYLHKWKLWLITPLFSWLKVDEFNYSAKKEKEKKKKKDEFKNMMYSDKKGSE